MYRATDLYDFFYKFYGGIMVTENDLWITRSLLIFMASFIFFSLMGAI